MSHWMMFSDDFSDEGGTLIQDGVGVPFPAKGRFMRFG